jgi:shikimate dehydrogenase
MNSRPHSAAADALAAHGPDRYAVIGHPVAHSRSPAIHAAFAAQTGQALQYDKLECPPDGFAAAVQAFAASGARGCNVTVPFKFEALALAGRASERALLAGAANTLGFEGADPAQWWACNTDGIGLVRDLQHSAGWALAGSRLLLVGAGGAGAGVLGPLLAARPARLVLANRSLDKAQALLQRHAAWAAQQGLPASALAACTLAEAPALGPFDIVINASASSLAGAASPVDAAVLARGACAVDLMYGPAAAPFLAWARAAGAQARDGLGMLVEQAAEAFFLWRGQRPATAPVLAALRAQVDGA